MTDDNYDFFITDRAAYKFKQSVATKDERTKSARRLKPIVHALVNESEDSADLWNELRVDLVGVNRQRPDGRAIIIYYHRERRLIFLATPNRFVTGQDVILDVFAATAQGASNERRDNGRPHLVEKEPRTDEASDRTDPR